MAATGRWRAASSITTPRARPGGKDLWTDRQFVDFDPRRLAPQGSTYINKNVPYILPDGTHAKDIHGKEMKLAVARRRFGSLPAGLG